MALQASGRIKYSEIIAEFGTPSGGIGEYLSENVGSLLIYLKTQSYNLDKLSSVIFTVKN